MSAADFPDVLATTPDGAYRVRMVPDLDSTPPTESNDGFVSVFVPTHAGLRSAEIVGANRECDTAEDISEAIYRFGGATVAAVRYLRIMRGVETVSVDLGVNRDYRPTLAAVDPARAEAAGVKSEDYAAAIEADAALYRTWAVGDVWGLVVERAVQWARVGGDETMTTWEDVAAVYGLYGEDAAREYAVEFLGESTP